MLRGAHSTKFGGRVNRSWTYLFRRMTCSKLFRFKPREIQRTRSDVEPNEKEFVTVTLTIEKRFEECNKRLTRCEVSSVSLVKRTDGCSDGAALID